MAKHKFSTAPNPSTDTVLCDICLEHVPLWNKNDGCGGFRDNAQSRAQVSSAPKGPETITAGFHEKEALVAYSRNLEERNRRLERENRELKEKVEGKSAIPLEGPAFDQTLAWRKRLQVIANEMADYLLRSSRE